jgi:alkylation response protein AidB-like acyl-CoA dehydrogenase
VRVPTGELLGRPGEGWRIAMTTVSYERGPADIGFSARYGAAVRRLAATVGQRPSTEAQRPATDAARRAVARAYVYTEVLRLHVLRSLAGRPADGPPGPESSVDKLLATRTEQLLHQTAMDVHGAAPLLGERGDVLFDYFYSRAASIAGGTSQIQRSIVAERLLGLPKTR